MSWGTGAYGTSTYGGLTASLTLSYAFASSVSSVRVVLAGVARATSPFVVGDALNPGTWAVSRTDTGAFFSVIGVEQVNSTTFDVFILEKLGSVLVGHQIETSTLRSEHGELVDEPRSVTFPGVARREDVNVEAKARERRYAGRDFINPVVPDKNLRSGTLQITAAGDYGALEGAELVKKLILRRLLTPKGGFFHLPAYGIDLGVKQVRTVSDLVELKNDIERQVREEPEVMAAKAQLTQTSDGVLNVKVTAQLKPSGQQVSVGFQVDPNVIL